MQSSEHRTAIHASYNSRSVRLIDQVAIKLLSKEQSGKLLTATSIYKNTRQLMYI
jgi:hypothetical protein